VLGASLGIPVQYGTRVPALELTIMYCVNMLLSFGTFGGGGKTKLATLYDSPLGYLSVTVYHFEYDQPITCTQHS